MFTQGLKSEEESLSGRAEFLGARANIRPKRVFKSCLPGQAVVLVGLCGQDRKVAPLRLARRYYSRFDKTNSSQPTIANV